MSINSVNFNLHPAFGCNHCQDVRKILSAQKALPEKVTKYIEANAPSAGNQLGVYTVPHEGLAKVLLKKVQAMSEKQLKVLAENVNKFHN